MAVSVIDFEKGWETIQRGIDKIVSFYADGLHPDEHTSGPLRSEEYLNVYRTIYDLCTCRQNSINEPELYSRYRTFCQQYLHAKVLPAVRGKSGELMLREVVKRWRSYKIITRSLSNLFLYLDLYYTKRRAYPTLRETALLILQEQVYDEMKEQIISTVLKLIREDRDGNSSDLSLIKEVLETIYDLESQTTRVSYQTDFEPNLLSSSCAYYLIKFKKWSQTLSSEEYMSQFTECVNAERSRAEQYLHPSTINKLLEVIVPDVQNPYWSSVICLGHQVEQLEGGTSNLVRGIEELTINDADGCLLDTSEKSMDDDSCLPSTSKKPMDCDDDCSQAASEEIMEDEYVVV